MFGPLSRGLMLLLCLSVSSGCATYRTPGSPGPKVAPEPAAALPGADLMPCKDGLCPPEIDPLADPGSQVDAASLLDEGFEALRAGRLEEAQGAFARALSTQELNDAGRALCYWHICACQMAKGELEAGRNSLADFIHVAENLLDEARTSHGAPTRRDDFIARFDVVARLERARAVMSSAWAQKVGTFGRTPKMPVPVHSDTEMLAFVALMATCKDPAQTRVLPRGEAPGGQVQRIDVSCHSTNVRVSFYFEPVAEQPSLVAEDSQP